MYSETFEQHMTNHIIEQLAAYGYTETHGKTREQLTAELARCRALEININAPENKWW